MRGGRRLGVIAAALTSALVLAACGDDAGNGEESNPRAGGKVLQSSTLPSASPGSVTSEPTPTEQGDDAVEIDVSIEGGAIAPLGETVEAEVGQPIRVVVDSDVSDELHVHSDPEHTLDVQPGVDQVFTFRIDEPAVYEMESHELGVVVAKLQISE